MTRVCEPGVLVTPGLGRRLACFVYEGVLLFGVIFATGLVYALVTQQSHALKGSAGLGLAVFGAVGLYFVYFWSYRGQTLPMQTWHVRLVTVNGESVPRWLAACRYVLAWLWFLPACTSLYLAGLTRSPMALALVPASGVLVYAALSRLHPDRQYLHDAICHTRLVIWHPSQQTTKT